MQLSIRLHLAVLSLSDTSRTFELVGVERCRFATHNWVQKADLQPTDGAYTGHGAIDETAIQLNNDRFWLHAVVDPETPYLLHVWSYPTRTRTFTEMFLSELRKKNCVADAVFLVDAATGCRPPVTISASDSKMKDMGIGMPSNASFENSNGEPTSSRTVSATPKQLLPKIGFKHLLSCRTSLSEHYFRELKISIQPPVVTNQGLGSTSPNYLKQAFRRDIRQHRNGASYPPTSR